MSVLVKEEIIFDEVVGIDTIGECVKKCGEVIMEGYGKKQLYNVFMTCMYEAVANAVKHGNAGSSECVTIVMRLYDDKVSFIVKDCGPGFNWENYDFEFSSDLNPGGRGLKIIKYYSEELLFNNTGNLICVTLPVNYLN